MFFFYISFLHCVCVLCQNLHRNLLHITILNFLNSFLSIGEFCFTSPPFLLLFTPAIFISVGFHLISRHHSTSFSSPCHVFASSRCSSNVRYTVAITMTRCAIWPDTRRNRSGAVRDRLSLAKSHDGNIWTTYAAWSVPGAGILTIPAACFCCM